MNPVWFAFLGTGVLFIAAGVSKRDIFAALFYTLLGAALVVSSVNPIF